MTRRWTTNAAEALAWAKEEQSAKAQRRLGYRMRLAEKLMLGMLAVMMVCNLLLVTVALA